MARLLFASMPFDGHFNPLTGLAVHLQRQGHDVRWYTGPSYAARLAKLGIRHLPMRRAREVNGENLATLFPEYEKLGSGPKAIEFALREVFFGNLEAHYRDLCEVHDDFAFDAVICDAGFYASRMIAEKLQPRVYVVQVAPTPAPTSKTAPPPFFALKPARSIFGRVRDRFVSALIERTNRKSMPIFDDLRAREGLPPYRGSLFDIHNDTARAMFHVGTPALEFPRDDWPTNHQFVGALLPHREPSKAGAPLGHGIEQKLERYDALVVVSQGTVDNRDPGKLIEPTLAALRDTAHLVVATTGHRHTAELAERYAADNVVVADWIDFDALMQHADAFVCNGGYGSVMLALSKGVPLVLAGRLEGKLDVNARIDYVGAGVDLRSERPTARRIADAVRRVLTEPRFRETAARAKAELARLDPFAIICAKLEADGVPAPTE